MIAQLGSKVDIAATLRPIVYYLQRPLRLYRTYDRNNLRADAMAGVTVAVILLPQAIAFSIVADLPPKMGLYAAIVAAIFGGLWGSSNQTHTGPANAISLLVLSALPSMAVIGEERFIIAAGLMAVMVGVFQLVMGLARLGFLVNFVSHSVIVGFAQGAGVLIAIKQLGPLLGISVGGDGLLKDLFSLLLLLPQAQVETAVIGLSTIFLLIILQRINPKLPAALITMSLATFIVFIFHLDEAGVGTIGIIPQNLPPLANLPLFDLDLIATLSTGALAVGAIGLVETAAIARSLATQTGQRLDSNQEFVGQGLANIFAGLFSGYPVAGSFSRSAVNLKVGAKTSLAAVFSSLFVLLAMFALAPAAAYLPRTALAAVLIVTSYRMIDMEEIGRIWTGTRSDAIIMLITFLGTLFLAIEFAVLLGILVSFALYIVRTSIPRVQAVLPDAEFKHFTYQPERQPCPQLGVIEIQGDLYFGAVNHVEETIIEHLEQNPEQRILLIRMHTVNHCDFSGIHMLENVVRLCRDRGGDVYMVRVNYRVYHVMESTHFCDFLGDNRFLIEDEAISHLFHNILDPAVCIYECPIRVFKECQNLPKRIIIDNIPLIGEVNTDNIKTVSPQELWGQMWINDGNPPFIVDVREPREFSRGHLPDAILEPLPTILSEKVKFPPQREIVLVCRTGRRSRRAAHALKQMGVLNVAILEGGILAWEAAGLLEAFD
jgi:SulP family sulfate permease